MEKLKPCPCCNGETYYNELSKSIDCGECGLSFSATWKSYPEWHALECVHNSLNFFQNQISQIRYEDLENLKIIGILEIEEIDNNFPKGD